MARPLVEIEKEIRSLSLEDKTELIRMLVEEMDQPIEQDVEQAWMEEAQRRFQELQEGKVDAVPGEQVMKNLRARLQQ